MQDWIQVFKDVIVIVVLVILSADAILRLVDALFGIDPFRKLKLKKEKERLQDLGLLLPDIASHDQTTKYRKSKGLDFVSDPQVLLKMLLKRYTKDLGKPTFLGRGAQEVKGRYFIDFNAPSFSDLEIMSEILAKFISNELSRLDQEPPLSFNKLAIPHRGNPALGIALNHYDYLRNYPYTLIGDTAALDWRFSGVEIKPDDTYIIIDDIASSGSSLQECAKLLRDRGATINHAFVLIERTDARSQAYLTPSDRLKGDNVILHACGKYEDKQLAKM